MQANEMDSEQKRRGKWTADDAVSRAVKIWLITGLVMVFMQVLIGGITRLTGSGLSITRWEIVTGTLPPLNAGQWEAAFALYKETPQYQKINQGMSLSAFKFIYFWEYFHRLWARLMFFVFVVPFGYFWWRGMFTRRIFPRLLMIVGLAALEGFFGWIMVASGLIHRPWVNAYNLTLHLTMALIIFSYLLYTIFIAYKPHTDGFGTAADRRFGWIIVALTFVQIALGAMMSGSKAGLFYPTWPDMQGHFLPPVLFDASMWQADVFTSYDTNPFMPAFIQVLHRNTAYILGVLILWFVSSRMRKRDVPGAYRISLMVTVGVLFTQILLGIVTLINCKGSIPVTLGVVHQSVAVLLLGMVLWVVYGLGKKMEMR